MTNFWGLILTGMQEMISTILLTFFPVHGHIGLAQIMTDTVTGTFALVFMVLLSQMDMTIVFITVSIILALESIRALVAVWEWIKTINPMT